MRVGMSTASLFNRCALEDAPALMAGYGVEICEIFLNTFYEYEAPFAAMLTERVRAAGLTVYSVHAMGTQFEPQLFSVHPRQRADAEKILQKIFYAGKLLGARYYVMHGPANLGGAIKNVQFSRIGPITQELCEMARGYGLGIAWENVSWGLYNTPEFGPALFEATNADDLRFTLDIKQAARSGYAALAYLEKMGDKMVNLHICDYMQGPSRITPMLPGKGEFRYDSLRNALEKIGYAGPAMFEVYSDLYRAEEEMLESYAYVKRCLE